MKSSALPDDIKAFSNISYVNSLMEMKIRSVTWLIDLLTERSIGNTKQLRI